VRYKTSKRREDMADNSHSCNTAQWTVFPFARAPVDIVEWCPDARSCLFLALARGYQAQPVIERFRSRPDEFDARICVTAQHREMLDQVLAYFRSRLTTI